MVGEMGMKLEAGKEMDRRCVWGWLNEVYRHPTVAFNTYSDEQQIEFAHDALVLLKDKEAVEPTLIREGRNKYYNDYVCPRCDNEVVYDQNYCSECGVQFLWEGR